MDDLITPNFSVSEMACKCGCGKHGMDEEFMRMLQELRNEVGLLRISSGFRCDAHNDKVSKIKNGPHTQAKASDILISGERAMLLFEKARQIGFSGIGRRCGVTNLITTTSSKYKLERHFAGRK